MDTPPTFPLRRRGLLGAVGLSAGASVPAVAGPTARLPLTASTTEGPYYFDARRVRSDITEGLPGVPLELRFIVLDEDARPLPDLRVDDGHGGPDEARRLCEPHPRLRRPDGPPPGARGPLLEGQARADALVPGPAHR